jgi:hypothetical protein
VWLHAFTENPGAFDSCFDELPQTVQTKALLALRHGPGLRRVPPTIETRKKPLSSCIARKSSYHVRSTRLTCFQKS